MIDNLIKMLTNDKEFRIYIVDAKEVLEYSNLKDMEKKFTKELYKKIFINCCLLRGFLTEKDNSTTDLEKSAELSSHSSDEVDKLCSYGSDNAH